MLVRADRGGGGVAVLVVAVGVGGVTGVCNTVGAGAAGGGGAVVDCGVWVRATTGGVCECATGGGVMYGRWLIPGDCKCEVGDATTTGA
jgi:hypothetical protein